MSGEKKEARRTILAVPADLLIQRRPGTPVTALSSRCLSRPLAKAITVGHQKRVEVQKQNVEAFAGRRAHGSATIAAQNLRLPQIKAVELRALEAANGG